MNRLYFLLAAGLISSAAVAQNQYDALKLMNNDLNGTARFVGMGGAMSALGADISKEDYEKVDFDHPNPEQDAQLKQAMELLQSKISS